MDTDFPIVAVAETLFFSTHIRAWPFRRISFEPLLLNLLGLKAYNFHSRPQNYELWIDRWEIITWTSLLMVNLKCENTRKCYLFCGKINDIFCWFNRYWLDKPFEKVLLSTFTHLILYFRYLEVDFFRLFRVTRGSFEKLQHILISEGQLSFFWSHGKEPIGPEKMIQVALSYLSSQQTLRQIGDTFNLADSSVHSIRNKVCRALARVQSKLITWPNEVDAAVISDKFKSLAGFPSK